MSLFGGILAVVGAGLGLWGASKSKKAEDSARRASERRQKAQQALSRDIRNYSSGQAGKIRSKIASTREGMRDYRDIFSSQDTELNDWFTSNPESFTQMLRNGSYDNYSKSLGAFDQSYRQQDYALNKISNNAYMDMFNATSSSMKLGNEYIGSNYTPDYSQTIGMIGNTLDNATSYFADWNSNNKVNTNG